MRFLMIVPVLLAACSGAETLPEPGSAPRYTGEISVARSGGGSAGEVWTAASHP